MEKTNGMGGLSGMTLDAIGEIMNISLGSSATAISDLLNQRVNITTPQVEVVNTQDFRMDDMEPGIGVEIEYISGLKGRSLMILRKEDVRVIVELMLRQSGMELPDDESMANEISVGAIQEVMNLMMGASATAMSQMIGTSVNISPPTSFPIDNVEDIRGKYENDQNRMVAIYFQLMIGDLVNSKFLSLIGIELAGEIVSSFQKNTQEEAPVVKADSESKPKASDKPAAESKPAPKPKQEPKPALTRQEAAEAVRHDYAVQPVAFSAFDEAPQAAPAPDAAEANSNLQLIMNVPLHVTVEIGRTVRKMRDVLDFSAGTIVKLDKQAGSQVDVFVNGNPIARGDVVIVDDMFGVRITEILNSAELVSSFSADFKAL